MSKELIDEIRASLEEFTETLELVEYSSEIGSFTINVKSHSDNRDHFYIEIVGGGRSFVFSGIKEDIMHRLQEVFGPERQENE